jgi:hypothetical protein
LALFGKVGLLPGFRGFSESIQNIGRERLAITLTDPVRRDKVLKLAARLSVDPNATKTARGRQMLTELMQMVQSSVKDFDVAGQASVFAKAQGKFLEAAPLTGANETNSVDSSQNQSVADR